MVCVTISRNPWHIDDKLVIEVRDCLHKAIVEAVQVKPGDVELRVRDVGPMDLNTPPLAIDVEMGPGKDSWRVDKVRDITVALSNALVIVLLGKRFNRKGSSNLWVKILQTGASMPIGAPQHMH